MDEYDDTTVILQDLPSTVRAFCYHDDEGHAFMVINSRLTLEEQRKAYRHEKKHIKAGDMYNSDYTEYGGAANG